MRPGVDVLFRARRSEEDQDRSIGECSVELLTELIERSSSFRSCVPKESDDSLCLW